ncbi:hypothetical protein MUP77_15505 [Candidatus Bathyarchaeota archaeon]|nr:hypothetical protein [Candidatus Bathyarchaeota archaeon]
MSSLASSYLLAIIPFDFNLRMLEDLEKELPFLLEQYSSKKQKLSREIIDGLDERTKSEFRSLFHSVDEMQSLTKNIKDGTFFIPQKLQVGDEDIFIEMLYAIPMIYMFDEFIREMCLVYTVTLFETLLEKLLRITFKKCPECLSSSKTITFEEVVGNLKNNAVLDALIKKEIDEVLRSDIGTIDKYFHDRFNIGISGYVPDWSEFKERFYRRNNILHNSGIVNDEYRRKTGYVGEEKSLIVSEDYLEKSFELFRLMSRKIMGTFYRKFETEG